MDTVATRAPRNADADAPTDNGLTTTRWPLWQKMLFRFCFVYLLLQVAPWNMFNDIPGVSFIIERYGKAVDWAVQASNAGVFHVRETLIQPNGSGDTSFAWAEVWLYLSVALLACIVWSALDRKRGNYLRLSYWLRLGVRYYVASAALTYGTIKLFGLQMAFPSTSQLATPLGDLLPMRFSWLFIGYSMPYQIFSGVMGCELTRTPNGARASLMAFITAAGAPAVPASPAPLAPSKDVLVGLCTWPTTMSGISAAIGTK